MAETETKTKGAEDAQLLITDIEAAREKALAAKLKPREALSIYASGIGECDRQLVYNVTNWKDKKMWDVHAQARMNKGNDEERLMLRELEDLGFSVVEQQAPLAEDMRRNFGVGGRIDGKLVYNGRRIPFEVKSVNPRLFDNINTVDDLQQYVWMRKYPRQLTLYMLGHNEEVGILALSNLLGQWKFLVLTLDYAKAEDLLVRLESVNGHIKGGTLPERIDYDEDVCGSCAFAHICLPDIKNTPQVKWDDNPVLLKKLERRRELEPAKKEFEAIDKEVKATFDGAGPTTMVGDFIVTRKEVAKKEYMVKANTYTTTSIKHVDDRKGKE
jgi:CRISPR/Cas system-associated exonuclease Cas4 (RecB family)